MNTSRSQWLQKHRKMVDSIAMVMPYLPVELAGESAKQRIAHLVTSLPATSGCGFEVRLGNQADQVDFCLRAMASEGGREAFSEYEPVAASPPANQAKWHALREFCLHWCDPSSPILDHVNNVWLEFDLDQSAFRRQAPSVFFDVGEDAVFESQWIVTEALSILRALPADQQTEQALHRCLSALPARAGIYYLGAMLARPQQPVRLCLKMPVLAISTFLKKIGWRGNVSAIKYEIEAVPNCAESIVLGLDLQDIANSKIGVEIKPRSERDWPSLLDALVAQKACTPAKRDALMQWPGQDSALFQSPQKWHLQPPDTAFEAEIAHVRRLNHIKYAFDTAGLLEVKAYLYAGFLWRTGNIDDQASSA